MHACIVGGGVIGCAIALELRRLFAFDVTVIERHGDVGHGTTSASCDVDREPLDFALPRVGRSVNSSFLSRLRENVVTTATVIG